MSASVTAHSKVVALLDAITPSASWGNVYSKHAVANLLLPSISIQVETDTPLDNDKAINQTELHDNRNVRLSVYIHTAYRLGPTDTVSAKTIVDEVIRELRTNIDLSDGYRIFDVLGVAYDVEHGSSATTGAEVQIDIHKVEFYEQN